MYEFITEKTLPEYEAFVQSHPKGNFAQSYLWGKQKPMWKWDAIVVRGENGAIKGSLAVMTRKVPGIGLFAAVPVVSVALCNKLFIFVCSKTSEKWFKPICIHNASGDYTFEGVVLVAVLQVCSKN